MAYSHFLDRLTDEQIEEIGKPLLKESKELGTTPALLLAERYANTKENISKEERAFCMEIAKRLTRLVVH